jgi:MinD-like ATPase involved in chromosome partitioning or flagellar assembly
VADAAWQQSVLQELGASQRGLVVLAEGATRRTPVLGDDVVPPVSPSLEHSGAMPAPAVPAEPAPQPADVPPPMPERNATTPAEVSPSPPPPPLPVFSQPSQPQPSQPQPVPQREAAPAPPPPFLGGPESGAQPQPPALADPSDHSGQSAQEQEFPSMVRPETGAFGAALAFGVLEGVDPDEEPYDPSSTGVQAPVQQQPPHGQAAQHGHPSQAAHATSRSDAEALVRKVRHGDPFVRRMGRGVRMAVGGGAAQEAQQQAAFAELMQRSVPSCRQIAVASVRGGAGKTTMAALVASELARHRPDRVLAADADAELGSLPLRLGVNAERSLFDLAGTNPRTFEEAARFLARTGEGLWVMSSTRGGRIAGEFTLATFQTALSAVTRYLSAVVIDCGAGILTELNRGILAQSHGLVLVTPGTVDGALSARGALEWFAGNDQQDLLARTVIAMVSHTEQVYADLDRAQQMLAAWGLPVVYVPYDRHAATGGSLEAGKVAGTTRAAVNRIAHEVFARSLSVPGASR